MKNNFIIKYLQEFYEENRENLLSIDEILNISQKSIFKTKSMYDYTLLKLLLEKDKLLFGFPEGILFSENVFYIFELSFSSMKKEVYSFPLDKFLTINLKPSTLFTLGKLTIDGREVATEGRIKCNTFLYGKLKDKINMANDELEKQLLQQRRDEEEKRAKAEERRLRELNKSQISMLNALDKDGNGEIDLIENDFNKLLNKNQKKVIEIDKNYIHQFVKISNYIKTKKINIQKIYESIKNTQTENELDEMVNLLKNQIHTYELLVFHSINMIGALVSEDLITFYEIYESFDKLEMFNSNWENEVSEKLINMGNKLDDLMYSIYQMENNIVNEISNLSYVTQDSFANLNESVSAQLKEVESSINTNNLLTAINTYQLYKINRNTKRIN